VDAICINQKDTQERNAQVRIMRSIYQQAERTVIWLGEATESTWMAFELCERIVVSVGRKALRGESVESTWRSINGALPVDLKKDVSTATSVDPPIESEIESLAIIGEERETERPEDEDHPENKDNPEREDNQEKEDDQDIPPRDEEVDALYELIGRDWWRRIWIIQEVVVAKDATVVCGKWEIEWDTFASGLLLHYARYFANQKIRRNAGLFIYFLALWQARLAIEKGNTENMDILTLANRFRKSAATDPRDKLFAIYGITTTDLGGMGLYPDYGLAVDSLYIDFALAMIASSGNLDVFSTPRLSSSSTTRPSGLPLWVPDWSTANTTVEPLINWGNQDADTEETRQFDACKGTAHLPSVGLHGKSTLRVTGHVFDTISTLGTPVTAAVSPDIVTDILGSDDPSDEVSIARLRFNAKTLHHTMSTKLEWEELACLTSTEAYPTGEPRTEAWWRTLCTNFTPEGKELAVHEFDRWQAMLHTHGMWTLLNFIQNQPLKSKEEVRDLLWLLRTTPLFEVPFWRMMRWTVGRTFAITSKGYFAFVPASTQLGDSVAVCRGSKLPLITRQRGNGWELIGAAYVHGIMHGEGFQEDLCRPMDFI
jgi:hypothetical protein